MRNVTYGRHLEFSKRIEINLKLNRGISISNHQIARESYASSNGLCFYPLYISHKGGLIASQIEKIYFDGPGRLQ